MKLTGCLRAPVLVRFRHIIASKFGTANLRESWQTPPPFTIWKLRWQPSAKAKADRRETAYTLNGFALAERHVVQSTPSRDDAGGANGSEESSRASVFPITDSGRKAGRAMIGASASIAIA